MIFKVLRITVLSALVLTASPCFGETNPTGSLTELNGPDGFDYALSEGGNLGEFREFNAIPVGRYYKTEINLPWAINIYADFVAPPESIPITLQYPKLVNWAN
ncbi:DUF4842 domain-containing protein [Flagellimonas sp. 2504JD4-2]